MILGKLLNFTELQFTYLENGGAKRRRKDNSKWRARGQIKVYFLIAFRASLVAQMVKHLPEMRETQVQSLDWEDPLEKGMATAPVFLSGESPWTEEAGRLQSMGLQRVGHE